MNAKTYTCLRCGKEMPYADKYMLYIYKATKYGKLTPKAHIDLCERCAKRIWMVTHKYCEKGV